MRVRTNIIRSRPLVAWGTFLLTHNTWIVVAALASSLSLCSCTPTPPNDADAGTDETDAGVADAGPILAGLDERCASDGDCASGVCTHPPYGEEGMVSSVCASLCEGDADCAERGEGYVCTHDTDGESVERGVCHRSCEAGCSESQACWVMVDSARMSSVFACVEVGPACASQADCDDGLTCSRAPWTAERFAHGWHCAQGGLAVGESCDPALPWECASETCASGVCTGACASSDDCPANMMCTGFYERLGDGKVSVPQCIPRAGSAEACALEGDCDGMESCALVNEPDLTAGFYCQEPPDGAVGIGERCGDDVATLDVIEPGVPCTTNLCMWVLGGDRLCTEPCATQADCLAGWQCLSVPYVEGDLSICLPGVECATDAGCGAGEVCAPQSTSDGFVGRCIDALGELPVGAQCDASGLSMGCGADAECTQFGAGWRCDLAAAKCSPPAAELCTLGRFYAYPDICTAMCQENADCGDNPDLLCAGATQVIDNQATADPSDDEEALLPLCVPVPGSRASCTKDADCTGGEVCRPHRDPAGALSLVCATPLEGGAAVGTFCGYGSFCANVMCDVNDGDGYAETGTCATPCTVDTDCPAPLSCQDLTDSRLDEVPIKACRTPEAVEDFSG